jgi:hypothetical protein
MAEGAAEAAEAAEAGTEETSMLDLLLPVPLAVEAAPSEGAPALAGRAAHASALGGGDAAGAGVAEDAASMCCTRVTASAAIARHAACSRA